MAVNLVAFITTNDGGLAVKEGLEILPRNVIVKAPEAANALLDVIHAVLQHGLELILD